MMKGDFGRVVTAMVTPFTAGGELDLGQAAALARRLIDSGNDGIVVAGTTGESPTLTLDEKLALFETVIAAVGDKVPVLCGTGSNNTADSIALSQAAERLGAAGVMLVAPYYNKPSQTGLFEHFRAICAATNLPVMLYNIPSRTGVNVLPETIMRIAAAAPNLVAVKEAGGSIDQMSELISLAGDRLTVYSGDDSMTLPLLAVGGHGIVSVAGHVVGRELRQMIDAYVAGETAAAARLHQQLLPFFKAIFVTTNPAPIKAALRLSGFEPGPLRLPLVPLSAAEEAVLRDAMSALNLLSAPAAP